MRTTITDTATAATRRPARAAALVAAAAILAAATSACADRPGPIDPAGARARPPAARASLVDERGYSKLVVDAGDPSLRMLTVEVRGKGIEGALEFKLKGSFGTVAVPAGEGRFIVLRAYDAEGREAYVGETSLDVSPETNPQVEIPLKPAYGGEPLVATVGSYHAVIDPRLTTIEVGRQVELHATVLDPDGWKVELREGASQWLLEDDRDVAFLDIPPSDPLTAYLTVFRPGTFQLVYCYLEVNTCRRQKIEFVPAPPDEYVAVDAGGFHSCGLRKSGRAHCWGDNRFGEAASGRTGGTLAGFVFTQITAGGSYGSLGGFSCALDGAGQAWCWGKNNAGQLGNGATSSGSTAVPQQVAGGFTFTAISAGGAHACGITTAGAAVCWGSNVMGQLGNGTGGTINDFSAAPLAVSANGLTFTSISAGGDHSCGVVTGGAVRCWGSNMGWTLGAYSGQSCDLGMPCSRTPVALNNPSGLQFALVYAGDGDGMTCAVATSSAAYCWGSGYLGDPAVGLSSKPVLVTGGLSFASAGPGFGHSCGRATSGEAWCWGQGWAGQLGNGVAAPGTNSYVPVRAGTGTFSMVSAGSYHSCGVETGGQRILCWGNNVLGQLGDGTTTNRSTPTVAAGW